MIPFAFFMSVWGILFLRFLARRTEALATVWDVRDLHKDESRRAEYFGTVVRKNPVSGRMEAYMPDAVSFRLRLMTHFAVLISLAIMIGFQFLIILSHAKFAPLGMAISTAVSSLFTIINVVALTPSYMAFALFLTRAENHRTQLGFES
ncbi:hypothetical protein HDU98_005064 [Podochytrium sp. JEL0797]|nr:hypothetical protein HDU98_005064 [Podochytrium sp. JEL0797]